MSAARQHQQAQQESLGRLQRQQQQQQQDGQQDGQQTGQVQGSNQDQQLGLYRYKVATLSQVERGLHLVEVLGCIATTVTAVRRRISSASFIASLLGRVGSASGT